MALITLDHPESEFDARAYTRINLNRAIVGNRWMERTWSAFFGTTISLLQKSGEVEWVAANNPEFSFRVNDVVHDAQMLDEVNISEECSEMGASVCIKKSMPSLDVIYTTTALHDSPLLLRHFNVSNTGNESVVLSDICCEGITWDSPKIRCWTSTFSQEESSDWSGTGDDAVMAVQLRNKGIVIGAIDETTLHLEHAEPRVSRVVYPDRVEIPPRKIWHGPMSYLITYEGDPFDAHTQHYTALLNELRLQQKRAEEIERLLAEEER